MSDIDDFLATIVENPDDDAPRLVFADYLQEQGQVELGQFIQHQVRLSRMDLRDPNYSVEAAAMYRCGMIDGPERVPFVDHIPMGADKIAFHRGLIEFLEYGATPAFVHDGFAKIPLRGLRFEGIDLWTSSQDLVQFCQQFPKLKQLSFNERLVYETPDGLDLLLGKNSPFPELEELTLWDVSRETLGHGVLPTLSLSNLKTFCLYTDMWALCRHINDSEDDSSTPDWSTIPDYIPQNVLPNSPLENLIWLTNDDLDAWANVQNESSWHNLSAESFLQFPQAQNLKRLDVASGVYTSHYNSVASIDWTRPPQPNFHSVSLKQSELESYPESLLSHITNLRTYRLRTRLECPIYLPNLETLFISSAGEDHREDRPHPERVIHANPSSLHLQGSLEYIQGCDFPRVHTLTYRSDYRDIDQLYSVQWNELKHLSLFVQSMDAWDKFARFEGMPNLVTLDIECSIDLRPRFIESLGQIQHKPFLSLVRFGRGSFRSNLAYVVNQGRVTECRSDLDFSSQDPIERFYGSFDF